MSEYTVNPVVEDITAEIASHPEYSSHEKVFLVTDAQSGLKAKIAIHSLVEGRALGGCRRWEYRNDTDWSADALRLSRGMTKKSAVAGLPLGGAKAAINHPEPTKEMMYAFGVAIDMIEKQYGMTYITAEDVGITEELLIEARKATKNVRGITPEQGEVALSGGDPGPFTAYGCFVGMQTAVRHRLGKDSMEGVSVAIQGLGDVGYYLCEFLHKAGAKLFVTDLDGERLQRVVDEFGAMPVLPENIVGMDGIDIFAPCAMGGSIDHTIKAPIVAGSANNQQKDEINNAESRMLHEKGILYAPDYVINSGGLISVFYEGETSEKVMKMIGEQVEMALDRVFTLAKTRDLDTATISDDLAMKMVGGKEALADAMMDDRAAA